MKSKRFVWITSVALVGFLAVSLALNLLVYRYGHEYYLQLNSLRLDPLGLKTYEQNTLENGDGRPVVVFFGDSRAYEWFPPNMQEFEFINRGIGAQTSTQISQRFIYHVEPLNADVLIVQMCINDLKTIPIFPEQYQQIVDGCKTNLEQVVQQARKNDMTVVLTTVFPLGTMPIERRPFWSDEVAKSIDEVNQFIHSLANERVIVFDVEFLLIDETGVVRSEYSRDFLHLNAEGYDVLNEKLMAILLQI